jgi:hypothetical protein
MPELGREAAHAVVRMARAGSASLRAGLAAGVRLETKPGRLSVGI